MFHWKVEEKKFNSNFFKNLFLNLFSFLGGEAGGECYAWKKFGLSDYFLSHFDRQEEILVKLRRKTIENKLKYFHDLRTF